MMSKEALRVRAADRRAELDDQYVARFAQRVRDLYPGCPHRRETQIAEHACRKYSGRVGQSADAKALDEDAVRLAVVAHVRHTATEYDELLVGGCDRQEARARVTDETSTVLREWSQGDIEQPAKR